MPLWRGKIKPPVELVVDDLEQYCISGIHSALFFHNSLAVSRLYERADDAFVWMLRKRHEIRPHEAGIEGLSLDPAARGL